LRLLFVTKVDRQRQEVRGVSLAEKAAVVAVLAREMPDDSPESVAVALFVREVVRTIARLDRELAECRHPGVGGMRVTDLSPDG
jgi:hypothetical protein